MKVFIIPILDADVGWNPKRPIFHEREDPIQGHEEHEGKAREITRGNMGESLNQ